MPAENRVSERFLEAFAYTFMNMFGATILISPPLMAAISPSVICINVGIMAAGVIAFLFAFGYARLAKLYDQGGGTPTYLKDKFNIFFSKFCGVLLSFVISPALICLFANRMAVSLKVSNILLFFGLIPALQIIILSPKKIRDFTYKMASVFQVFFAVIVYTLLFIAVYLRTEEPQKSFFEANAFAPFSYKNFVESILTAFFIFMPFNSCSYRLGVKFEKGLLGPYLIGIIVVLALYLLYTNAFLYLSSPFAVATNLSEVLTFLSSKQANIVQMSYEAALSLISIIGSALLFREYLDKLVPRLRDRDGLFSTECTFLPPIRNSRSQPFRLRFIQMLFRLFFGMIMLFLAYWLLLFQKYLAVLSGVVAVTMIFFVFSSIALLKKNHSDRNSLDSENPENIALRTLQSCDIESQSTVPKRSLFVDYIIPGGLLILSLLLISGALYFFIVEFSSSIQNFNLDILWKNHGSKNLTLTTEFETLLNVTEVTGNQ